MKRRIGTAIAFICVCALAYSASYVLSDRYYQEKAESQKRMAEQAAEEESQRQEVRPPQLKLRRQEVSQISASRKQYKPTLPTEEFSFYLQEDLGFVNVYLEDRTTIYEYTDIALMDLPRELQEEICQGKGLKNEQELYDFMENYSS